MCRQVLTQFISQQHDIVVAMEVCYSSHHWARTCEHMGHTVRFIPTEQFTLVVKGNKSDNKDAVAIAEAACCPILSLFQLKVSNNKIVSLLNASALSQIASSHAKTIEAKKCLSNINEQSHCCGLFQLATVV